MDNRRVMKVCDIANFVAQHSWINSWEITSQRRSIPHDTCGPAVRLLLTGNAFSWRWSIELVSPIDSYRRKMEQIDRKSALFGFLGLSGILFELTTVGLVVHTFYPLPSLRSAPRSVSAFLCTERAAPFRLDGAEQNGNVTVFLTPTVHVCKYTDTCMQVQCW